MDLRPSEGSQHKPVKLEIVCSVQAVGVVPSRLRWADVCLANDLVAEILHSSSHSLVQGYADVLTSCSQRKGMEMP